MFSNKIGWNFDNTYSNLPQSFISKISPIPVKFPELTIFNYKLAEELGLNFSSVDKKDLSKLLSCSIFFFQTTNKLIFIIIN